MYYSRNTTTLGGVRTLAVNCGLAALALLGTLASAGAYEKPYDPYKWCWVGENTNCGYLTLEQCRMSHRNCEPNPFYNPRLSSQRHRR